MDRYQKAFYEKDFQIKFLESRATGFQEFFETLMKKVYCEDFMACVPWGRHGDQKNDGYLRSRRILFQVYAPKKIEESKTIKKIKEDFEGAKPHWKEYFDTWIFVYNESGLPPEVLKLFLELEKNNPSITCRHWGYKELLAEFRKLRLQDLESWFGSVPSVDTDIGFADLGAVLYHINTQPLPPESEIKEVSPGKIEANLLSSEVAEFLKIGMKKAPLVEQFFDCYKPDPTYGEKIAQSFKDEYQKLVSQKPSLHPDAIFGILEKWATGTTKTDPKHKFAVLTVIAYLFDKCEIFEDAQAKVSS